MRKIAVTGLSIYFKIRPTEGITEVKGSLRTDPKDSSLGLELENRHGLLGEELDSVARLLDFGNKKILTLMRDFNQQEDKRNG